MNKINNKVKCFARLFYAVPGSKDEILDFLKGEEIYSAEELNTLKYSYPDPADFVFSLVTRAIKDKKINSMFMEWTLLPNEYINIHIITQVNQKQFIYSE